MRPRLAVALFLLASSLVAQTVPTPPVSADRQPIATPAVRETVVGYQPSIASNGETFLAVWDDWRFGNTDVAGRRFDGQGRPLDTSAFSVLATWRDDKAVVIWDGDHYVAFSAPDLMSAFATRISPDGEVSSREIAPWSALPVRQFASNTAYYATALQIDGWWSFVLIDRDFTIRKHVPLVPFDEEVRESTRIASDGTGFLVAWHRRIGETVEIHAQRFDAEGVATGAPTVLARVAGATYRGASIRANDNGYILVWSDAESVRGLEVDASSSGQPFVIASANAYATTIAWDGRVHLVLWGTEQGRSAAVVTSSGEVLRTFDVDPRAPSSWPPAVAGNGDVFLVLWDGERYVIDLTASSPVVEHDPKPGAAFVRQETPVIAPGATMMLAAWIENGAVYANRIGPHGEHLDGAGIHLSDVPTIRRIEVAASGDTWLVVWSTDTQVRGTRVTSAGEVLDPEGFDIGRGDFPRAAGNGADFRVVWAAPLEPGWYTVHNIDIASVARSGPPNVQTQPRALSSPYPQLPRTFFPTSTGEYVLLYRQQKDLPCRPYCPPRSFDHRIARFERESLTVASQRTVIFDTIADAEAAIRDDRIVIAYPNAGTVETLLTDLDGLALAPPSVLPLSSPFILRIAATPRGFALVADRTLLQLDAAGHPRSTAVEVLAGDDKPTANDLAFHSGILWIAYTAAWTPMPLAHTGTVQRAYLAKTGSRPRAVGR